MNKRSFFAVILILVGVAFSLAAAAQDLHYADSGLDTAKLYDTGGPIENVDLFRGALRVQSVDVHLPGKYGLNLDLIRWYDSKIQDMRADAGGSCQTVGSEGENSRRGEILGYGWRMHMGRYRFLYDRDPGTSSTENPADILELPGGRTMAFYRSTTLLEPPSNTFPNDEIRISPEGWLAVIASTGNGGWVKVYSPEGITYIFNYNSGSPKYSDGNSAYEILCCMYIEKGAPETTNVAKITINYGNFSEQSSTFYKYITSITDSFGRTVSFCYYHTNNPYTQNVFPLYNITFPTADTTQDNSTNGSIDYYYTTQSSSYPPSTSSTVSGTHWYAPSLGSLTTPTPRTFNSGGYYFALGKVKPYGVETRATLFEYYFNFVDTYANGGIAMAGIRLPNGATSCFDYAFITRPDFSVSSCYHAINSRSLVPSSGSGDSQWDYAYAMEGTYGAPPYTARWKVTVTEPTSVGRTMKYYFNPMVRLGSIGCGGDCDGTNGYLQRWRSGLLLEEQWLDSSGPTLQKAVVSTYGRMPYDTTNYPYNAGNFKEHGYFPVKTQEDETLYFGTNTLTRTKSTAIGDFDIYGNPTLTIETNFQGSTIRKTSATYLWSDTPAARGPKGWLTHTPRLETLKDGSNNSLNKTYHDYYTGTSDAGVTWGFPKTERKWVDKDSGDTSTEYWTVEDFSYSTTGTDSEIVTEVGHIEGSSYDGLVVHDRAIITNYSKGTETSRTVKKDPTLSTPSIAVFTRTLDTNSLVPKDETVYIDEAIAGKTTFTYEDGRLQTITPPSAEGVASEVTTLTFDTTKITSSVGSREQTIYTFDEFGNLKSRQEQQTATDQTTALYTDTVHDAAGRVTEKDVPRIGSTRKGYVTYEYDCLGRVTEEVVHDGGGESATTTYLYSNDGNLVKCTITSPPDDGQTTEVTTYKWYDSDGNLVKLTDALGTGTTYNYDYDVLGHLLTISVTGQSNQGRTLTYSNMGQVLTETLPELDGGTVTYTWDKLTGQVKKRKYNADPGTKYIQYDYDFAGRKKTTTLAEPGVGTTWTQVNTYKGNNLTEQEFLDGNGHSVAKAVFSHDSHGRIKQKTNAVDGVTLNTFYGYDGYGHLSKLTYPSGRIVLACSPNGLGLPATIKEASLSTVTCDSGSSTTIATSLTYNAEKKLVGYTIPGTSPAITMQVTSDGLNRPTQIVLGPTSTPIFKAESITYWPTGSLNSQNLIYGGGGTTIQNYTYSYDDLHRLVGVSESGGTTSGTIGYAYDAFGNMTTRTGSGAFSSLTFPTTYSFPKNRKSTATYDNHGNLTLDGSFSATYNSFNQVYSCGGSGGTTETLYDAQGRKIRGTVNGVNSYYLYDETGQLLTEGIKNAATSQFQASKDYIYTGGRLISKVDVSGNTGNQVTLTVLISPTGGGYVDLSPAGGVYDVGQVVTLTAHANASYSWWKWTLDAASNGTTNPIQITMTGNKTVQANFTGGGNTFWLTTQVSPSSAGTVTPAGTTEQQRNTPITITAYPASTNYVFNHWSGTNGYYSTKNPETLIINQSEYTVAANFDTAATQYCISKSAYPTGWGTVQAIPPGPCYPLGTQSVAIKAIPSAGFRLEYWTDNGNTVPGNPNPYNVLSINQDHTVVAHFGLQLQCITLTKVPANGGTVNVSPAPQQAPYCYLTGQVVTLTATASTGYKFKKWIVNGVDKLGATLTVTMNKAKNITAKFGPRNDALVEPPDTLEIGTSSGQGTISLSWKQGDMPSACVLSYKPASGSTWKTETMERWDWNDQWGQCEMEWVPPSTCTDYALRVQVLDEAGTPSDWSNVVVGSVAPDTRTALITTNAVNTNLTPDGEYHDLLSWSLSRAQACAATEFELEAASEECSRYYGLATVTANGGSSYHYFVSETLPSPCYRVRCNFGTVVGPWTYFDFQKQPAGDFLPGDPTFIETNYEPWPLVSADTHGDALPDLMTDQWDFDAYEGTFRDVTAVEGTLSDGSEYLKIADVNGDGILDRILGWTGATPDSSRIWIEFGNENGTYTPTPAYAVQHTSGDTLRAIAVGHLGPYVETDVAVLTGANLTFIHYDPDLGWQLDGQVAMSGDASAIAVGDLNGDGLNDVVVAGAQGVSAFLWQEDDGDWVEDQLPTPGGGYAVDVADANGDGYADVAVATVYADGPYVYLFTPNSGYDPTAPPIPHTWTEGFLEGNLPLSGMTGVKFADLNGSGLPGLILYSSEAGYYLSNNGAGGLLWSGLVLQAPIGDVAVGDFDGDGRPDLAADVGTGLDIYFGQAITSATDAAPPLCEIVTGEVTDGLLELSWSGSSDDRTPSPGLTFEVIVGTEPGKADLFQGEFGDSHMSVGRGNMGNATRLAIPFPEGALIIYWAVRPVDASFRRGAWTSGVALLDETTGVVEGEVETQMGDQTIHYVPINSHWMLNVPVSLSALTSTYFYTVQDVTGTPRVWVNSSGALQEASRSALGPYGENLNLFTYSPLCVVGFAGYLDDRNRTGDLIYTPNRYLNLAGRFVSPDPSYQFSLDDPRSLNQYAYVFCNPLLIKDPAGLWGSDFANWLDSKIDQAQVSAQHNVLWDNIVGDTIMGSYCTVLKQGSDTFRLGEGAVASHDAWVRGDHLEAVGEAFNDIGRASNVTLVLGLAGKGVQVAAKGTKVGAVLARPLFSKSVWGGLSKAAQYGAKPYKTLTGELKGSGLQAHHLIEQRFASKFGIKAREMASIAVTPEEHQAFTNAWRAVIPYGSGTLNATPDSVMKAAAQIYANYPAILRALGL